MYLSPVCDVEVTSPAFITSPEYPESYPLSINCNYNITAPGEECVTVLFLQFDLEGASGEPPVCENDYVEVKSLNMYTLVKGYSSLCIKFLQNGRLFICETWNVELCLVWSSIGIADPGYEGKRHTTKTSTFWKDFNLSIWLIIQKEPTTFPFNFMTFISIPTIIYNVNNYWTVLR